MGWRAFSCSGQYPAGHDPLSLVPEQARAVGMDYAELVERIVGSVIMSKTQIKAGRRRRGVRARRRRKVQQSRLNAIINALPVGRSDCRRCQLDRRDQPVCGRRAGGACDRGDRQGA